MDGNNCILLLRGVRPFFSDKFDLTKHPRYRYIADANPKNTFDLEGYKRRRPDEPFELYELKEADFLTENGKSGDF